MLNSIVYFQAWNLNDTPEIHSIKYTTHKFHSTFYNRACNSMEYVSFGAHTHTQKEHTALNVEIRFTAGSLINWKCTVYANTCYVLSVVPSIFPSLTFAHINAVLLDNSLSLHVRVSWSEFSLEISKKTDRMNSYFKFAMVFTLIVLVNSMPQELGLDDSVEYIESSENETESEAEAETSTMATTSTTTTTTTASTTSTTSTTTTTSSIWRPTRTTTTARPFQPLRPNRPLASMVHSTLQTIESIVVSSGILATTLLESLMPTGSRPIQGNNKYSKANISNETPSNAQLPEYSALDFRENEIPSKFE